MSLILGSETTKKNRKKTQHMPPARQPESQAPRASPASAAFSCSSLLIHSIPLHCRHCTEMILTWDAWETPADGSDPMQSSVEPSAYVDRSIPPVRQPVQPSPSQGRQRPPGSPPGRAKSSQARWPVDKLAKLSRGWVKSATHNKVQGFARRRDPANLVRGPRGVSVLGDGQFE